MSKISVIIPCYNAKLYIGECLESVMNQTYKNIEVLCIDDGSTDDTLLVLEELKKKYPGFITVISIANQGAPNARNVGLKLATGEIIQFLDSDDVLKPTKFESQLKGFDIPGVNVVVSDRVSMNQSLTEVIYRHDFSAIEKKPLNTVISQIIITGNPLYKKSFIMEIGAWDVALPNAQDWELNIRAILNGAIFKYIKGDFLVSRGVLNSLSSNWKNVSNTSAQIIIKNYSTICKQTEKLEPNSLKKIFYIFYISALHSSENNKREYIKFIADNIVGWQLYINNPLKKIVAFFFGLNGLINIEKRLKKS